MAKDSSRELSSVLEGGVDTIVARATPNGRSALAIVRVSGKGVERWAERVAPDLDIESSWKAQLVTIYDRDGNRLERGVAVPYREPKSYTGEDMVELIVHGSTFLVQEVMKASVAAGCRVAEPGEFTRRAVCNGKMDLLQAGAVRDMIDAETRVEARRARRRLEGELSIRIGRLRRRAVELEARIEAAIEYSEQGVEISRSGMERVRAHIEEDLKGIAMEVAARERGSKRVRAVISGAPNAGKSTLFNYLVGWQRAIVDSEPGTTRDVIEAEIEIGDVAVKLVDTAGVRQGGSGVEGEGIRRALATAAVADIEIVVCSVEKDSRPEIVGDRILRVRSKVDIGGALWQEDGWIPVSVKDGTGLDRLKSELQRLVRGDEGEIEDVLNVSERQREKLVEAINEIEGCDFEELELAAERVRWVVVKLSEIVGEIDDEEILDEVFAGFCIGK
jgi:tRNA modification GTPase